MAGSTRFTAPAGFTLIELMIVVLIISILLTVAVPTFLGARDRANDRAAQSNLRNTLTAAKTLYQDAQSYAGVNRDTLRAIEPGISYVTYPAPSTGPTVISTHTDAVADGGDSWTASIKSKSGKCFVIRDSAAGSPSWPYPGTGYGINPSGPCIGMLVLGKNW